MKILTAQQNRDADTHTIKNEPISSIDLMERAATTCFQWMMDELSLENSTVHVFCGVGNNGGDGLVIARLLAEQEIDTKIYVVRFSDNSSDDFKINLDRAKNTGMEIIEVNSEEFQVSFGPEDLIIDSIFGTGLNKPVGGWLKKVFQKINLIPLLRISIDLPSGLFAEFNEDNDLEAVIKADYTLTFQQPKLALVLTDSGAYCGEWHVLDIGLDGEFIESLSSDYYTTDENDAWLMLKERGKFDHKGDYGHALIAAGSKGKMGASVLSGRACLRSGIGLLTQLVPECGYEIIQTCVPEAMCLTSKSVNELNDIPDDLTKFKVVGVGPGIGISEATVAFMHTLLDKVKAPIVIDADAVNILSENQELLISLPENSILTPHPGEFRRLLGDWNGDKEKLEKQIEFSKTYKCILVLKGAHTCISMPSGQVHFNTTGNPGMATAGSGDVLLGIITGLSGRGYEPQEAARLGVYLHGLCGDIAKESLGEESMKAGDLIEFLSQAFLEISL